MRPSEILAMKRDAVVEAARRSGMTNLRVFGSVARGADKEGSDIDFLVDASEDEQIWELSQTLEDLLGVRVDLLTPTNLLEKVRDQALAEALPVETMEFPRAVGNGVKLMDAKRLVEDLDYIIENALEARSDIEGVTREEFLASRRPQKLVAINFLFIGETAGNILRRCPEFAEAYPDVPWKKMNSLRNRVAHRYDSVDFETIWDILQNDLPLLIEQMTTMRQQLEAELEAGRDSPSP